MVPMNNYSSLNAAQIATTTTITKSFLSTQIERKNDRGREDKLNLKNRQQHKF